MTLVLVTAIATWVLMLIMDNINLGGFLVESTIAVLGGAAAVMALSVQSVQALWFFTSDLVFVLLFPQLVCALFDRKANLAGSIAAFAVSLVLRLGGGGKPSSSACASRASTSSIPSR